MLPTRLNVGCGRDIIDGWVNLDIVWHEGMERGRDIQCKLGTDDWPGWAGPYEHFTEIEMSHVIEHIPNALKAVESLWWAAAPNCKLTVRCPHGSSDDAWGDPTHVRPMFESSFIYWGQGAYWRADYGYRGDWAIDKVTLRTEGLDLSDVDRAYQHIRHGRNFVVEMIAELRAVKPARPATIESQDKFQVELA